MKFPSFDNIYKGIVIIAIGYLIFNVLSIINISGKNIDKIEKSQQEIMQSAKDIIAQQEKRMAKADSIDQVRIQKIQDLTNQITTLQGQVKSVQTEIKSYKQVFDKNKVDLPNPWQK